MSGEFGFGAAGTSPPQQLLDSGFFRHSRRSDAPRAATVFVITAVLFAGCARPTPDSWQAVDLSRVERDHAECRARSLLIQPTTGGLGGLAGASMILSGLAAQREYYDNCMIARGYTKAK